MEVEYGLLALLPPLIAIVLCFLTRRVLISLFVGILTGGIIIAHGNPLGGIAYSLDKIVGSVTDVWNVNLLLFNLLMGAGVAFIWRLGGSKALAARAKKRFTSRRSAGVGAWLLGILVFFNDYVNAAIVGNVFRDIYDELKISKEKLSYILDSTAAPVATFFISDWIAFQIGMIKQGIETAGITEVAPFVGFIRSIPMNFYCIFAVVFVGILVISRKDFGPMLKAEQRALKTGETSRKGSSPMLDVMRELGEERSKKPMLASFILPLVVLIGVTLFGFWWTGGPEPGKGLSAILGDSDPAKALLWGAFAMTLVGFFMSLGFRIMSLKETMDTLLDGFKLMLLACGILVLAWSIGSVTHDMKLSDFIVASIGETIPFAVVPVIIFLVGMLVSFATGTSWGTMTILTPIAIPLAYRMTADPITAVTMAGVVFSGAIFGDHCSPISDTTVLASIFSGSDHMDHVITQIPYALTCAGVAVLMYVLYGLFRINVVVLIVAGIGLLVFLASVFSRISEKKHGISS